ncbi:MAG: dTDP-4-dehydrorhamnose reductase [Candidatus Berkelbacteria bacterium Athens1014_28]|uniref:dTDP-4-dehydrorhamnose reductase n=1 Tax=Candidatus Berkelbacteria bacterium Athens1014_28 TaxID=2017145 RepID=A0A554LLA6_9BACT|nr:MAG: dTDP-4-dehydrorhamnose reductase [Candidatus Berkelbacteria bacterium Athens1014_28]
MKILIAGANGQLGTTLQKVFAGDELILTDSDNLDITDKLAVENFVDEKKPDLIINAAAYTAVDKAEVEKELAQKINVDGAKNLALAAKKIGALIIHISTDFVFDGKKGTPYVETDQPNPLSIYGETKYQSELAVSKNADKFYIFRTSWLFSEFGKNFVKTMIKLGREKDQIKVVNDQIGSPTYAFDLAETMKKIIELQPKFGLYHFSNSGSCSWFDFAKKIIELSDGGAKVLPQTSSEFAAGRSEPTAIRPAYSVLNCKKIEKLGIFRRPWKNALEECVNKILTNE